MHYTHARTHSLIHSPATKEATQQSITPSLTHLTRSLTHSPTLTHSLTHSHSLTHTHTHSHSPARSSVTVSSKLCALNTEKVHTPGTAFAVDRFSPTLNISLATKLFLKVNGYFLKLTVMFFVVRKRLRRSPTVQWLCMRCPPRTLRCADNKHCVSPRACCELANSTFSDSSQVHHTCL